MEEIENYFKDFLQDLNNENYKIVQQLIDENKFILTNDSKILFFYAFYCFTPLHI